jgi:hypothetical protein
MTARELEETTSDRRAPAGPLGVDRDTHPHRCTAKSKRSGERCRSYAMKGSATCRMHGSAAGQVRAAAKARRLAAAATADAERLLAHEAADRMADPWETLGRLAVEADAMKQALGERVNALGSALRYVAPGSGAEQLRAEVALYERAMDRSAKFADLLLKHHWEERQVRVQEATAQFIVSAYERSLDAVPAMLPADKDAMLRAFLAGLGRPVPGPDVVRGELG